MRAVSLFEVERYPSVFQLVSTVEGTLRDRTTLTDVFGALFPAGSITGAPKSSSMRLIASIEHAPRGVLRRDWIRRADRRRDLQRGDSHRGDRHPHRPHRIRRRRRRHLGFDDRRGICRGVEQGGLPVAAARVRPAGDDEARRRRDRPAGSSHPADARISGIFRHPFRSRSHQRGARRCGGRRVQCVARRRGRRAPRPAVVVTFGSAARPEHAARRHHHRATFLHRRTRRH